METGSNTGVSTMRCLRFSVPQCPTRTVSHRKCGKHVHFAKCFCSRQVAEILTGDTVEERHPEEQSCTLRCQHGNSNQTTKMPTIVYCTSVPIAVRFPFTWSSIAPLQSQPSTKNFIRIISLSVSSQPILVLEIAYLSSDLSWRVSVFIKCHP